MIVQTVCAGALATKCTAVRLLLVVCTCVVASCAVPGRTGEAMLQTELYFGTSRKNAVPVAPAEWQAFLDTCITPAFADGFTVVDAHGQWRNVLGAVEREQSRVLVVVHADTDEAERRIEKVRALYRQAFQQESVLRVTSPVRVSF